MLRPAGASGYGSLCCHVNRKKTVRDETAANIAGDHEMKRCHAGQPAAFARKVSLTFQIDSSRKLCVIDTIDTGHH